MRTESLRAEESSLRGRAPPRGTPPGAPVAEDGCSLPSGAPHLDPRLSRSANLMQLYLSPPLEAAGASRLAPAELRGLMEERFAWAVGRGHAVAVLAGEPLGLEAIERRDPDLSTRVLGALALALGPAFAASQALVERQGRLLIVLLVGPDPVRLEAA